MSFTPRRDTGLLTMSTDACEGKQFVDFDVVDLAEGSKPVRMSSVVSNGLASFVCFYASW